MTSPHEHAHRCMTWHSFYGHLMIISWSFSSPSLASLYVVGRWHLIHPIPIHPIPSCPHPSYPSIVSMTHWDNHLLRSRIMASHPSLVSSHGHLILIVGIPLRSRAIAYHPSIIGAISWSSHPHRWHRGCLKSIFY